MPDFRSRTPLLSRLASVALVLSSVLWTYRVQPARATHVTGTELLPDLQTVPPYDIDLVTVRTGKNTERRLRFANEVENRGTGPLELYPVHEPCGTGGTKVFQRLYVDANTNGFERGTDTAFHDQYAGCMEYHAQHRHWHFENFAKYSLHPITTTSGAEQLGTAIKESPKVSFCMVDTLRKDPSLTGSPAQKYYTECGRTSTLGISIGWSDVYGETLSGRYFEISGVPDGAYCIASTADPAVSTSVDGLLVESNNSNNSASTRVQLAGTTVTTTSTHPYSSTCGL